MKVDLSVGIDLGSDTIKIAFSYKKGKSICYGKFDNQPVLTQIALPALAYFDGNSQKWLFCDEVGKGEQTSFITVVKIKSLISLLSPITDTSISKTKREKIWRENARYFHEEAHFPKFYFPARRKMLENFQEMVSMGQTFVAKGYTPKSVCRQFFQYIEGIVSKRIAELEKADEVEFKDYKIALVHPSSVGTEYIDCVCYLIKDAFNKLPHKILSSNKALAIFAEHRKAITQGEDFLVFDMAEEDITVARIGTKGDAIIVDGKDGHNDPCDIGGVDVDEAIVDRLMSSVGKRETIGTPSLGKDGHIVEDGVYGKQYLLMKDIKMAKVLFCKYANDPSKFPEGIPVTLSWDLYIQRYLTKKDVEESIGVKTDSGIAKQIYKYLLTELERPLNYNIEKVFLSGGLSETYSLLDYLRRKLKRDRPQVQLLTFDDGITDRNGFHIQSFEDSVFAPSVGGALASLTNKTIKTVLSLSYAAWGTVNINGTYRKFLKIFANRGEEIPEAGKDFVTKFRLSSWGITKDEELFSTFITEEDIRLKKFACEYYKSQLIIDEPGSATRKKLQKTIDLKTVSGGKNGYISIKYGGVPVAIVEDDAIWFEEGMRVDKEGRAHPIVKNVDSGNVVSIVKVSVLKQNNNQYTSQDKSRVYSQDIKLETNLTDFDTAHG